FWKKPVQALASTLRLAAISFTDRSPDHDIVESHATFEKPLMMVQGGGAESAAALPGFGEARRASSRGRSRSLVSGSSASHAFLSHAQASRRTISRGSFGSAASFIHASPMRSASNPSRSSFAASLSRLSEPFTRYGRPSFALPFSKTSHRPTVRFAFGSS